MIFNFYYITAYNFVTRLDTIFPFRQASFFFFSFLAKIILKESFSRYQRANFQSCTLYKIFLAEHFPISSVPNQSFVQLRKKLTSKLQPSKGIERYPLPLRITMSVTLILDSKIRKRNLIHDWYSLDQRKDVHVLLSRSNFRRSFLISLELDSLRISPRSTPFLPFTCIQFFPEAAYIIFYRDSDANSKDRRARSPPSVNANGRGGSLARAWFFSTAKKSRRERSLRETRRVARLFCDETSRKNRRIRRESAGGSSAKRDSSRGYAFSDPFKSRERSLRG